MTGLFETRSRRAALAALLLGIAFTFSAGFLQAEDGGDEPPQTDARQEPLDALVRPALEAFRKKTGCPGISAAYVLADGREGVVAVGWADREAEIPLKGSDRLLSGSIGKTYVAAVAMQLVAEKRLDLDGKIGGILGGAPWFDRLPNGKDVTVRMLMNHTSGVPEHVYHPDFGKQVGAAPDRVWKPAELVAFILDAPPRFPAGEGWAYADTNYILLGMVIEKITKNTYYGELRKRILEPLALSDTVPADSRTIPALIPGYAGPNSPFRKPGKTIRGGRFVVNPQAEWTGGGLACTPRDLARWGRAVYRGKAFPEELLAQVFDGVPAYTGKGDRYGLGVQICTTPHGLSVGHGGWFPGYISRLAYYRDHGISLAVQLNTDRVPKSSVLLKELQDGIAGQLIEECRHLFPAPLEPSSLPASSDR